ncbi:hypothetical protein BD560DRAFT_391050 [Blakeslea trispora]|nr:hypothetical protein BD560DRAFT_391050 [Blakeslea trispora]
MKELRISSPPQAYINTINKLPVILTYVYFLIHCAYISNKDLIFFLCYKIVSMMCFIVVVLFNTIDQYYKSPVIELLFQYSNER